MGIADPELTEGIGAPALDGIIVEDDAGVQPSDCEGFRAAARTEVHGIERGSHFPDFIAAVVRVSESELPMRIAAPTFDKAVPEQCACELSSGCQRHDLRLTLRRAAVERHRVAVVALLVRLLLAIRADRRGTFDALVGVDAAAFTVGARDGDEVLPTLDERVLLAKAIARRLSVALFPNGAARARAAIAVFFGAARAIGLPRPAAADQRQLLGVPLTCQRSVVRAGSVNDRFFRPSARTAGHAAHPRGAPWVFAAAARVPVPAAARSSAAAAGVTPAARVASGHTGGTAACRTGAAGAAGVARRRVLAGLELLRAAEEHEHAAQRRGQYTWGKTSFLGHR